MDSQCRILLVDGDNANLLVMQQILDSAYEVEFAFTAREAAFRLASGSFDLIISGYTLPDMALPDFLSSIKRISKPREIPVIVMSDDDDPAVEENSFRLGAQDFISKNSRIGVIENRVMRVLELYQYRAGMERRYQEQEDKLERIRQNIVEAFASIIEGRDQLTGMHIQRTASYVSMVVRGLVKKGYYFDELEDEAVREAIVQSAPLHDIGKIAVSDVILLKPGRLTHEEFEIMKQHARIGGRMIKETLKSIEKPLVLRTAVDMATYHHEKWNGKGYPDGLRGEQIPLCARVMAIADVFDALVSKRCYKEAFSYEQSFKIIQEESGQHFDPRIAEVFLSMKDEIIGMSESWALGGDEDLCCLG
ncbi:HD-GYP domain-containing protein [Succinimonas amylolytica]|uniref:HD-GYP domain-containing protein n=1 Tax=Succinimonas amylolytica TaxID=83769 RepID=UPI0023A7C52D